MWPRVRPEDVHAGRNVVWRVYVYPGSYMLDKEKPKFQGGVKVVREEENIGSGGNGQRDHLNDQITPPTIWGISISSLCGWSMGFFQLF